MNEVKLDSGVVACNCGESGTNMKTSPSWKSRKSVKTIAMYLTMVCVSTIAIYWLSLIHI